MIPLSLHIEIASCSMSISGLEWRKASVPVLSPFTGMKNAGRCKHVCISTSYQGEGSGLLYLPFGRTVGLP